MLTNSRFQFVLLFFAIAVVYAMGHEPNFYLIGDDKALFKAAFDYPLPKMSLLYVDPPTRLIDYFYSRVWFHFFFEYIYGGLYKPFFGQAHFVDVYLQVLHTTRALVFAGFCVVSIFFVRLFVSLKFWQMVVYAFLFYLFFEAFTMGKWEAVNYVTFVSYISTELVVLCFLYPVAAYVLAKKNVFEKWDQVKAVSFMVLLSYFALLNIAFAVLFASIALFLLCLVHFVENYSRADFQSLGGFWQRVKAEPAPFLATAVVAPIFSLTSLLLAYNSGRLPKLLAEGEQIDSLNLLGKMVDYVARDKFHYDDKQIAFFVIIFALTVGAWGYRRYKGTDRAAAAAATPPTTSAQKITVRWAALAVGIVLFALTAILLALKVNSNAYTYVYMHYVRFILVTLALGYGFQLLQQRWAMPITYLLFFIFTWGSVGALVSQEPPFRNVHYYHNNIKVAFNLGYTFSCYGETRAPFYNKLFFHQWNNLPSKITAPYAVSRWQQLTRLHGNMSNDRFNATRLPRLLYYYEPSIEKINAKLAEVRAKNTWQCLRVKNDIYRIEKLGY